MYLNSKKIKYRNKFFLILFIFIYLLLNFYKTNLIFAGKSYSKIEKTDSLEKMLDDSKKEIEILKSQIDELSKQKNSISQEIDKSEKDLLFCLQIQNKKNYNTSKINTKFQIYFLTKKKCLLKKQLNEISLEQIDLENKLRKILYSVKN